MIYFIGIKGTGMAALACILHDLGYEVSGSDLEKHFFTEIPLIERGIQIIPFDTEPVPDNAIVIIGNAFDEDFNEVAEARRNSTCQCFRYHEYLGQFMKNYTSFCVAGSHGKTTTTGMLASMLNYTEPTGYLIGDGTGVIDSESTQLVVEACEFRRHFLAYDPEYAIITNIEIDHVDYFKDKDDYRMAYEQFSEHVKKSLVVFGDDEEIRRCHFVCPYVTYGVNEGNDYRAVCIEESQVDMQFDVEVKGKKVYRFRLPFVGSHLLWNSLAVITVGLLRGIPCAEIEAGLQQFGGVKRRYVIETFGDNIFIDDYAHHPTEVSVTLDSTRQRYPNHKLIAIFKPHRASRVHYFRDEFAVALKKADEVMLCDFTSIDDHSDGIDIDIRYLQDVIEDSVVLSEDDKGAELLASYAPAVYLFMSSKDIYHLSDKVKYFLSKKE